MKPTFKKFQDSVSLSMIIMLLILLSTLSGYAQKWKINGYIVKNNGERIECNVFNSGYEEATTSYNYILPDSEDLHEMDLATIKEFGIGDDQKFIREFIQTIASNSRITKAEEAENVEIKEGHGYLKVIYEGPRASLYSFYDEGNNFYYYKVRDSEIALLFYKQYHIDMGSRVTQKIIENNTYKDQLTTAFKPEDPKMITRLSYTKKSLVHFFETVNQEEVNSAPALYKKISKGYFRVNALGGINFNEYRIQDFDYSQMIVFSKESSFTYGLEFEYILPFNKHRFGLFLDACYTSYKTDKAAKLTDNNLTDYEINYKSFEFPVGISFNVPLSKEFNIFAKAGYAPQVIMESSYLILGAKDYDYAFSSSGSAILGAGIRMGRFSAEYRYYSNRHITQNLYNLESRLTQSSILVGISLFETGK